MQKLYLSERNSDAENVLYIIDYLKEVDFEQGLSLEEIQYKYTHGFCYDLVELINKIYDKVFCEILDIEYFNFKNGRDCHFYIKINDDDKEYYIDIMGIQTIEQVQQMMKSEFFNNDIAHLHHVAKGINAEQLFENSESECLKNIEISPDYIELG